MRLLWTILKFVIIWAIVGGLIIFGAIVLTNSLELGLKVFLGIFIIWLVFYIVYRLYKRYQAKKRVEKLVNFERGEAGLDGQGGPFSFLKDFFNQDKALVKRFNRIFNYLNKSKLGFLGGSAVYAKPWYLVMGEVSSKKERIFDNSDLVYPVTNIKDLQTEAKDIDFYLTNDAIYINTSGFLYPGDGEKIPLKLVQLLRTLAFQRPKEPINGVVMAIDVMELVTGNEETITTLANKQRFYLALFMAYLRVQVPVYLIITNAEKLLGEEYFALLKDRQLEESIGEYNVDGLSVDDFLQRTLEVLRFKIESTINLYMSSGNQISPELLKTISNLNSIEHNLKFYSRILFTPNQYQESAFLYGVYLSGNKGKKCHNVKELMEQIIPNDRGRVHMLERFRRRTISYSLYFLIGWISVSALVVFLIWNAAFSNITSITSIESDFKRKLIRKEIINYQASPEAENANILESLNIPEGVLDLPKNVTTIAYMRDVAKSVDEQEKSWILPWKSVSGVENAGTTFKYNLYLIMKKHLIDVLDGILARNFSSGFSPLNKMRMEQDDIDKLIADFAVVLYYRIDLLNKILNGATADTIKGATPFVLNDLYFGDTEISEQDIEILNSVYIDALLWHREGDRKSIEKELEDLTDLLNLVIQQGSGDLQWIIGWANRSLVSETIDIDDYFLGSGRTDPPLIVGASFTALGNTIIDDFIVKMFNIFGEDTDFYKKLGDFRVSYMSQFTNNWGQFLMNSYRGTERLRNRDEWYNALQQMTTDNNPYFRVMNRMLLEMTPLLEGELLEASGNFLKKQQAEAVGEVMEDLQLEEGKTAPETASASETAPQSQGTTPEEDAAAAAQEEINILQTPPEWVALSQYYQEARQFTSETTGANGGSNKALTKVALKVVSKAGKAGKQLAKAAKKAQKMKKSLGKSKTAKSADELESNIEKVAKELDNFFVNITNIALEGNNKPFLYTEIQSLFANSANPENATGNLANSYKSFKQLQNLIGVQTRQNEPFWIVFNNTIRSVQEFMAVESSIEIQELWNKEFLYQLQGVSDTRIIELVFNPTNGILWGFASANIDPFVDFMQSGTITQKVMNGTEVKFTREFLEFYYNGQQGLKNSQSFYPVFFEAGPTSVNSEALFKPVKTIISLSCGDTTYLSINLNFYSKDLFEWTPSCGDAILTVDFSVFTVSKTYQAPNGFVELVRALRGGVYKLTPDEFPDSAINLKDINVREINLRYNILGLNELLKGVDSFPTTMPQQIVQGWEGTVK